MQTNIAIPQQENGKELLRRGIAAAKSGQREQARELLMRLVELDEENTQAWLWLSGLVESIDDREVCLENVLTLDPENAMARRGLDLLHRQKVDRLLNEGIVAAKAGQRQRACELLTRLVELDTQNVTAWLWLSGVVGNLDEREACLKSALAVDPDNTAVHKGLSMVRKQRAAQAPSPTAEQAPALGSPLVTRGQTAISPAAAILRQDTDQPLWEPASAPEQEVDSSATIDIFDDEYLCPYCMYPTAPKDRRCHACHAKLWVTLRVQEKRSSWLWTAILFQGLTTLQSALPLLIFSFIVFGGDNMMMHEIISMYAQMLGVPVSTINQVATFIFFFSLAVFLVSLTILVALYMRWKPAYYLFVTRAAFSVFWAAMSIILSFTPADVPEVVFLLGGGNLVCNGINFVLACLSLWAVFQMQHDFDHKKERILFRTDPSLSSGSMLLVRGQEYIDRKMWGLAALHLQRGVGFTPDKIDGRKALTLVYLKLRQYDLAARALKEAKRISPSDPQIQELQALLEETRPRDRS